MKRLLILVGVVFLLGAASASIVGWRVYRGAAQPYKGYRTDTQSIDIPQGLGTQAIGERLVEAGVIRDTLTFRIAIWRSGQARRLQAGEYRFEQPMTAIEVLDKIARGEVDLIPLTFPEGLTIAEMAKLFEQGGFGAASTFSTAARDGSLVRDLDPEAAGSRRLSLSRYLRVGPSYGCAARDPRDGGSIPAQAHARDSDRGDEPGTVNPATGHARLDCREGDGASR